MTTTNDGLTRAEDDFDLNRPLLSEQVFALELLADPGGAERWLTKTDQADLPGRLLQWAQAVAAGTPRTKAQYWYNASPAYTRWLDARDIDTSTVARVGEVADDAGSRGTLCPRGHKVPTGPQEDNLRGRIERLESTLRETISLLAELASVAPVTPGLYGRLQRQAKALARAGDLDG